MRNEPINLLPIERTRGRAREYYIRLATVALTLTLALALAALALLVPTQYYLATSIRTKELTLAGYAAMPKVGETTVEARLTRLESKAQIVSALGSAPSASVLMRDALAVPREGISLLNINYVAAAAGKPGSLLISGTAANRDRLRTYEEAIARATFAASADLPVGAYAKDVNIPFTITIVVKP